MSKTLEKNLTGGSVVKNLIMFALPFLVSNIIQTLYNVVDMIVVGKFAGTAAMSGVNIGSQVTFIVTNMVMGLCVGGTVLIGQYLGAGDRKALKNTIATLFTTLIIAAVALTVIMIAVQKPLLHLIKTPEESFGEASSYFFVTMLGTIFIFGYNALAAVMRGMGDGKTPLIFVAVACVVNIFLDLLLVAVFGMAALGAAIATVISQAISMILCIIYLRRHDFIFDFAPRSFKIDSRQLKMLLRIGIPTSVQNVTTGVSFLFITTLVNTIGFTASAAVGAVSKLNGFAILPAVAMSSSISAVSAQNFGAGEIGRAKKTMHIGLALAVVMGVLVYIVMNKFPEELLSIFVDSTDPDAVAMVDYGVEYISSFSLDYLIVPFMFCLNGLFIGAGHTTFSLINNMLSAVLIRIPMSYIIGITMGYGLRGVGFGAPVASGAALMLGIIFYFSGKWKKMKIVQGAEKPEQLL